MDHPFLYVGHGVAAARKTMWCWVVFEQPIAAATRASLEDGVPAPLAGYFDWTDRLLTFGNDDDSLQWVVRAAYDHVDDPDVEPDPEMPSDAMWAAFNADIDAWAMRVHGVAPIALFIKPIDEEYSTATDGWHDWSCARIPSHALPVLAKHADVAGYVAQMWRAWATSQPFADQQRIVAALSPSERAALGDAMFEPTPEPEAKRTPSVDEGIAIWRAIVAAGPSSYRLEDAWEVEMRARGFDPDYALSAHVGELEEADRGDAIIEVSRAVLASGAEFPTNWLPSLADRLIAAGRLDEAESVVRDIVSDLESYKSGMLASAMRYHRARGDTDDEALLYHAGMRWFTSFNTEIPKAEAKKYGAAPSPLPAHFARWLERWVGATAWNPRTSSRIGHWLVWFDEIGKSQFGPQIAAFEGERERRGRVYKALPAATDDLAALAAEACTWPGDPDFLFPIAFELRTRAPAIAYDLLMHIVRSEARTGYRYPSGNRVGTVVMLMYLPLNHAELTDRMSEAYAIGLGYSLTSNANIAFNLACCACRLGRRDTAIAHTARALALNYPDPKQIHDDNDLEPLRGDPAFEQLFVVDAARRVAEAEAEAKPRKAKKAKAKAKLKAKPKTKAKAKPKPKTWTKAKANMKR